MNMQKTIADLFDKFQGWEHSLFLLLPNIVLALLVLLFFLLIARLLDRGLRSLLKRFSVGHEIIDLSVIAVFITVMAIGLFVALDLVGLDKTVVTLLAGAGILGLVLVFAFQSTGENYIAGIYLSVRRPFRVGQYIKSNDYFGMVERMELRATLLRVPEGQLVCLPNKKVYDNPIVNYSDSGFRRVDIELRVAYDTDLVKVKRIATEALTALEPRDLERDVEFFYHEFGSSAIDFEIRFWIRYRRQPDYLSARSEAVMRIKQAFDENGIFIPFPIRTLDFNRGINGETLDTQLQAAGLAREKPGINA